MHSCSPSSLSLFFSVTLQYWVSHSCCVPNASVAHWWNILLLGSCIIFLGLIIYLICRCDPTAFWRVDNSVGTFLPADSSTLCLVGSAYELRHIFFGFPEVLSKTLKSLENTTIPSGQDHPTQSERLTVSSARRFEAVASFQLIWWNQSSGSRKRLSIWRPIVPQGMVYFGDIAVQGYANAEFQLFYLFVYFILPLAF